MASTSTRLSESDPKTKDSETMQALADEAASLWHQITQKRRYRANLEADLETVNRELASLKKQVRAVKGKADAIDRRIHSEPSSSDFRSILESQTDDVNQHQYGPRQPRRIKRDSRSVSETQPISEIGESPERATSHGHVGQLVYPPRSSPPRKAPDSPSTSKASPSTAVSRTLVERSEEASPANVPFPSPASSPTDQVTFYGSRYQSPRNSESKAGTPLFNKWRRRTQSLLGRLPSISSPSKASFPQPETAPLHSPDNLHQNRGLFKRV